MTTTINASTAGAGGLITTADNSGLLQLQTAGTAAVTVDSSQNVGIGTSTPAAKLDIRGSSTFLVNATNPTAWISSDSALTTKSFYHQFNTTSNIAISGTYTNHAYTFVTNNAERMRIGSSGNAGIGTATNYFGERLTVHNASATTPNTFLYSPNTSFTSASLIAQSETSATTNWKLFDGRYAGGGVAISIYGNGNIQNLNNSYGALSDIKLKENIVDTSPKLDKLNKVRIVNFNLIGETQKQIGVIAQEVEQIFPSIVEESPDRDADGNDLGTTTKGVKYSVFVPILIKAIQEQQAIITDLKARIETLETK